MKTKTKSLTQFYFGIKQLHEETKEITLPPEMRDPSTYYWKKEKSTSKTFLLEFPEVILLSRIYFYKPQAIRFSLFISQEEKGDYLPIVENIQCTKDALKVIPVGFMPCKYIKIISHNGLPLPSNSNIKCFGHHSDYIESNHGFDFLDLLSAKAGNIIYKK